MRPSDVNRANERFVWERLYGGEQSLVFKYKFSVDDQIRISKARWTFKKGYLASFMRLNYKKLSRQTVTMIE